MNIQSRIRLNRLWVLNMLLMLGLLSFYIFQVVSMGKARFLVGQYEREIKEISEINKTLEINFSRLTSLKNIEDLAQRFNFEKAKNIHYLKAAEVRVATTK